MAMERPEAPRALRRPISLRLSETMTVMVVDTPTSVSPRTTAETTQNRVLSIVMIRVSPEVILDTGWAWSRPPPADSTAATTSSMVVDEVSTDISTTSYPADDVPMSRSTSAEVA